MPTINPNCPGDLAYFLCFEVKEIPESHTGDDCQDFIVAHYLNHISDAVNAHPLKKVSPQRRIEAFNELWEAGDREVLGSLRKFAQYCKGQYEQVNKVAR